MSHRGYDFTETFDSLSINPISDNPFHHDSSSSPASTIPSLSPTNNSHSSFDSPCDSPTDTMSTSSSSRDSSPDPVHSTSHSASPPSISPSPSPSFGGSTKAKRSLPPGRIKRPANPFMCFRTYFCKNKPHEVERHNATVSKITGIAWRKLSDEERLPYIAQAATIKAEFMAKHPDWRFKPRRNPPKARKRRTRQRTLADEQRYMRIALGFNSGKRGKELKLLAEMEAAGAEEASAPLSPTRHSRKSIVTKKTTKPAVSARIASSPAESNPQLGSQHSQISADFPLYTTPVHPVEEPPSLPGPAFRQELLPVIVVVFPSVQMPH